MWLRLLKWAIFLLHHFSAKCLPLPATLQRSSVNLNTSAKRSILLIRVSVFSTSSINYKDTDTHINNMVYKNCLNTAHHQDDLLSFKVDFPLHKNVILGADVACRALAQATLPCVHQMDFLEKGTVVRVVFL